MLIYLYLPFLAAVVLTFASTPDDVFITLRYAANFVHGHGLVFNPGERVQGFTSPLDLLVAIVMYLVPGGLALFKMKLASILFGLLAIREAGILLWRLPLPMWTFKVGCVAIGTCGVIAYASGNGLETSLEMWLLIAIARRLILDLRRQSMITVAVLAFFAVLARPDAVAPLTCIAIASLYVERDIGFIRRISWFIGVVIAASMTTIGEVLYFKSILPNTFYAKDVPLDRSLAQGWEYLHYLLQPVGFDSLLSQPILVNLVVIIEAIFLAIGTLSILRKHPRCTYLLTLIAGQVLFVLKSGGDWMTGGRFLAAAAIPLIIIEVMGALEATAFLRHHLSARSERYSVAIISLLLMSASIIPLTYVNAPIWLISGVSNKSLIASGQYRYLSAMWSSIPSTLSCLRPGQLVTSTEVGYLGFARQDLRLLDLRGLTSSAVARGAPASMKIVAGVQDRTWTKPTSPVGRVLLLQMPAVIIEFDTTPTTSVLGGLYRLEIERTYLGVAVGFYVPVTSTRDCPID
jgi:hypothetical protein